MEIVGRVPLWGATRSRMFACLHVSVHVSLLARLCALMFGQMRCSSATISVVQIWVDLCEHTNRPKDSEWQC